MHTTKQIASKITHQMLCGYPQDLRVWAYETIRSHYYTKEDKVFLRLVFSASSYKIYLIILKQESEKKLFVQLKCIF